MKKQQQANADTQAKKSEESDHSKENRIRAVSESTDDEIEMPRSHSLPNLTCAPQQSPYPDGDEEEAALELEQEWSYLFQRDFPLEIQNFFHLKR